MRRVFVAFLVVGALAGCARAEVVAEPEPTSTMSVQPTADPTPTPAPTPDPAAFTAVDPAEFFLVDLPEAWGGWDYEDVNFIAPSGNLACTILDHGVDTWGCKIDDRNWEFPRSSSSDYCFDAQIQCGNGIEAEGTGLPHPYQHSDPGFPATFAMSDNSGGWVRVLQYGEMVTFNGVTCFSEETHVTCKNAASGHGFVISRDDNEIF